MTAGKSGREVTEDKKTKSEFSENSKHCFIGNVNSLYI